MCIYLGCKHCEVISKFGYSQGFCNNIRNIPHACQKIITQGDTPTVYGEKTKGGIKMGKRKTFRSVEAARAYAKKTGGEVINNPKGFTDKRVGHLAVRKKK